MTAGEAIATILGGNNESSNESNDGYVLSSDYKYYEKSTTIAGDNQAVVIPSNSIVETKLVQYNKPTSYAKNEYRVFQLIIDNLNTPHENVVGLINMQTGEKCMFQLR